MQPTGVRFKPEVRKQLARLAHSIVSAMREGQSRYKQIQQVAADLDVSEPTARNLIAYGKRLADGRDT